MILEALSCDPLSMAMRFRELILAYGNGKQKDFKDNNR